MPQPLSRIVDQLKRDPSRTGSIVITVFGDAIVPRGGSVWLGTLLEFFAKIDIEGSVVRTAMSRLAADGWLERSRFGSPLPGVWVAPAGAPVPDEAGHAIRLEVSAEDESGRRLLSESWPLDRTAGAYMKFMTIFAPLHDRLDRGPALADIDAFTARILLIHHYRRVVLRDPLLPGALLPADWPGRAARALCGAIYRTLLPASERWLDQHAINEAGPLPAPGHRLARRFAE